MKREQIRNFSIIAHIDHGKSTLADRLLEATGTLTDRQMMEQVLDDMELERERGITIKSHPIRLAYTAQDGQTYQLNLIDTPGHVDFSYEVSRSLKACEGVLLLVDAAQGVEAQTLANVYLAVEHDLEIIPIINKIDLPSADIDRTREQIEDILGIDATEAIPISAKQGRGIEAVLEAIVQRIPPPQADLDAPLKALIFDSWFDSYQGTIVYMRVFDGTIAKGTRVRMMMTGKEFEVDEVGIFRLGMVAVPELQAGSVGYFLASIKQVNDTKVGDTVTNADRPADKPLPGFKEMKPMVFSGVFPAIGSQYEHMRESLEKLALNDASFQFEPEMSEALGPGFRCGFLGLLHMEIVQERLEREFDISLLTTAPSVVYKVAMPDGAVQSISNPARFPQTHECQWIEEPMILATIFVPSDFIGNVLKLAQERRGTQKSLQYLNSTKVMITYEFPLNEVVMDFYDRLKSATRGYASFDYEHIGYKRSDIVKLDILLNGEPVDALSAIVHREKAQYRGRELVKKMRQLIPRQLFEVAIQAALGTKVIARETIPAMRKNVTAKCYGGDITRKRKLLEKQKEGKKRMRQVGKIEVPQEAFMAVLQVE
ncbi:elongation factor 4 [candidate division KSB3 bacterium]|uniref:Elongation factor 4 n=1 Tax=candidate division KSB3 bacterium TaxID=2044937 RepID=A0A9D5JT88_9BACT|nr:elongation factor 4 [candidate division KSB3 bacterium]MBD3323201.1 elongation factor 4 [candidate division KSB3 bacterium]